jgi:hypothetical protein
LTIVDGHEMSISYTNIYARNNYVHTLSTNQISRF